MRDAGAQRCSCGLFTRCTLTRNCNAVNKALITASGSQFRAPFVHTFVSGFEYEVMNFDAIQCRCQSYKEYNKNTVLMHL